MLIILRNKKEISHLLEPRCVLFPFFAKNITQGFGVYLSITKYEQMCLLKDPIYIKTCPDLSPPCAPLLSQHRFQPWSAFFLERFGQDAMSSTEIRGRLLCLPLWPLPKEECREARSAQITFRCTSPLLEPICRNKNPDLFRRALLFSFFLFKDSPPALQLLYCGLELFH